MSDQLLSSHSCADDAGLIQELRRYDAGMDGQPGDKIIRKLGNASAQDNQIRPEELLHGYQVFVECPGPHFPAHFVDLAHVVGGALLGVDAAELSRMKARGLI